MMRKIAIMLFCMMMAMGCTIQQEQLKEVLDMELTSPEFNDGNAIPARYTCQGEDISPPLRIREIPEGTRSIALIVEDPDAPMGTWDHWVVWNISSTTNSISENTAPGIQGRNSWGKNRYGGPCPPTGTHRYFFRLYALDTVLDLPETSEKKDLKKVMEGHILAKGELMGTYKKS